MRPFQSEYRSIRSILPTILDLQKKCAKYVDNVAPDFLEFPLKSQKLWGKSGVCGCGRADEDGEAGLFTLGEPRQLRPPDLGRGEAVTIHIRETPNLPHCFDWPRKPHTALFVGSSMQPAD